MSNSLNTKKILSYGLILLFLTSVDTVIFGTNANRAALFIPRTLGLLAIFLFPILKSKSFRKIHIQVSNIWAIVLMISIMTISSIINEEMLVTYISRIVTVLLAYVICQTIPRKSFAIIFDKFMTLVASFAILTEVLAYLFPTVLRILPKVTNSANGIFYTYFFGSIQATNIGRQLIRSNGIFWEPGAFSIYLIFAILVQLFILDTINVKKVIVYIVTLIFTFSTTGYVSLGVLLLTYIFSDRSSKMSKWVKGLFVLFILGFIGLIFMTENSAIYSDVIGKLTSGTSSATTRYSSIFNGLSVAFKHPFIGVASKSQDYMYSYIHSGESNYTNGGTIIANTIVGWSVNYGLIFGILFLVGTIRFLKSYSHSIFEWLLLSVTVAMAYCGERFFSFFPFIFVFYGLKSEGDKVNENSSD